MKKILLLSLCVLFFTSESVGQQTDLGPPEASFIAVITTNLDSSLVWYQKSLNFKIVDQTENIEYGFKQANLKTGRLWLELIELNNAIGTTELLKEYPPKTKISGFFKFGFHVENFDLWLDHFSDHNVMIHGNVVDDPSTNKRMIIILDPDGNRIQVFEK